MPPGEAEKIILQDGWFLVRRNGSHCQYKHREKSGTVTIPFHKQPKDLTRKTLNSILKQAQIEKI